jgi:hypothetical protein
MRDLYLVHGKISQAGLSHKDRSREEGTASHSKRPEN